MTISKNFQKNLNMLKYIVIFAIHIENLQKLIYIFKKKH